MYNKYEYGCQKGKIQNTEIDYQTLYYTHKSAIKPLISVNIDI